MISGLKKLLERAYLDNFSFLGEAVSRTDNEDIRDRFIEDEDVLLMDAEDDPEINKLIDSLPEAEESEGFDEEQIEELAESFIPEDISPRKYNGTFSWMFK